MYFLGSLKGLEKSSALVCKPSHLPASHSSQDAVLLVCFHGVLGLSAVHSDSSCGAGCPRLEAADCGLQAEHPASTHPPASQPTTAFHPCAFWLSPLQTSVYFACPLAKLENSGLSANFSIDMMLYENLHIDNSICAAGTPYLQELRPMLNTVVFHNNFPHEIENLNAVVAVRAYPHWPSSHLTSASVAKKRTSNQICSSQAEHDLLQLLGQQALSYVYSVCRHRHQFSHGRSCVVGEQ